MFVWILSLNLSLIVLASPSIFNDTFCFSVILYDWRYFVCIFHWRVYLLWLLSWAKFSTRIVMWLRSNASTCHLWISKLFFENYFVFVSLNPFCFTMEAIEVISIPESEHSPTFHLHHWLSFFKIYYFSSLMSEA